MFRAIIYESMNLKGVLRYKLHCVNQLYLDHQVIEYSENKVIMYFETEVGPGVLQFSVQQTCNLQKFHTTRTESTHNQLNVVCVSGILASSYLLNA